MKKRSTNKNFSWKSWHHNSVDKWGDLLIYVVHTARSLYEIRTLSPLKLLYVYMCIFNYINRYIINIAKRSDVNSITGTFIFYSISFLHVSNSKFSVLSVAAQVLKRGSFLNLFKCKFTSHFSLHIYILLRSRIYKVLTALPYSTEMLTVITLIYYDTTPKAALNCKSLKDLLIKTQKWIRLFTTIHAYFRAICS